MTRKITVTLTIESRMTDEQVHHELFVRYGKLAYVWNNMASAYGAGSGVTITDVEVHDTDRLG